MPGALAITKKSASCFFCIALALHYLCSAVACGGGLMLAKQDDKSPLAIAGNQIGCHAFGGVLCVSVGGAAARDACKAEYQ